jgi:hypothetical protein
MNSKSRTGFELWPKVATVAAVTIGVCLLQAHFPVWFNKFATTAEGFIEIGAGLTWLVLLGGSAILLLAKSKK